MEYFSLHEIFKKYMLFINNIKVFWIYENVYFIIN